MSTHNIRFHREIRKILCGYPFLSEAMLIWAYDVTPLTELKREKTHALRLTPVP